MPLGGCRATAQRFAKQVERGVVSTAERYLPR
ncbi:hypothetical protein SAMN05421878_12015 [Actinobaculum suis]|uniref:Uncharacterized protein n=1 Tax=Actinobaculum suis TaxID=1657 RepID=A0A1G7ENF6_9ACTO|nr:hypothetical protein SAMN05421878_12015 [Actinobaculum suis]